MRGGRRKERERELKGKLTDNFHSINLTNSSLSSEYPLSHILFRRELDLNQLSNSTRVEERDVEDCFVSSEEE